MEARKKLEADLTSRLYAKSAHAPLTGMPLGLPLGGAAAGKAAAPKADARKATTTSLPALARTNAADLVGKSGGAAAGLAATSSKTSAAGGAAGVAASADPSATARSTVGGGVTIRGGIASVAAANALLLPGLPTAAAAAGGLSSPHAAPSALAATSGSLLSSTGGRGVGSAALGATLSGSLSALPPASGSLSPAAAGSVVTNPALAGLATASGVPGTVIIASGPYAGVAMTETAAALLLAGRTQQHYVHEHRRQDAAIGSSVFLGVGTNVTSMEGAAALLATTGHGSDFTVADALKKAAAASRPQITFIESLGLPVATVEALAAGDFVYLAMRPAMTRDEAVPAAAAELGLAPALSAPTAATAAAGAGARVAGGKNVGAGTPLGATAGTGILRVTAAGAAAASSRPVIQSIPHGLLVKSLMMARPNIYEMRVVDHKDTDPEDYFTLSKAGVTRFRGSDSQFVPLHQYEREYRVFIAMRAFPCFAQFRQWKAFKVWTTALTRAKRGHASSVLTGTLFILNPALRTALLRLRRLCYEVADWSLFSFDTKKVYTLESFMAEQNTRRVQLTTWLTEFAADVRAVVRGACDEVLDAFLAANDIRADHKMTFMERAALRTECRRLTKFIRLADFFVRDTLLQLALGSTASLQGYVHPPPELLPPHIVRTDLPPEEAPPITGALTVQVSGDVRGDSRITRVGGGGAAAGGGASTGKASGKAGAGAGAAMPMLIVSASFEEGEYDSDDDDGSASTADGGAGGGASTAAGSPVSAVGGAGTGIPSPATGASTPAATALTLSPAPRRAPKPQLILKPSLQQVKTAFKGLLYDAMVVISAPPRLLTHTDLAPYTQAATDPSSSASAADDASGPSAPGASAFEEIDLTEVATNHVNYKRMAMDVLGSLDESYAAVESFGRVFMPFAATYFANQRAADTMDYSYSGGTDVSDFERVIAVYKGQIAEFDAIPTYADVGVLRVDSCALKRRIIPSPARCLYAIRELLPRLMAGLTTSLVGDVRSMYTVLAAPCVDVEPFVSKMEMLEKTIEALPHLRDREAHIRALTALMAENGWGIADDLKAQFKVLRDALSDLDTAAQRAEASQDEDIKKFARQVETAIPVLKRGVLGVREKLDDALVAAADSPAPRVVKYLRECSTRMDELKKQAQKYAYYQSVLKQPVTTYETLDEVSTDLATKQKLWESTNEWVGLTASWRETPFQEIDAEEMGKQVGNYMKVAARCERALPGNAAAAKLRSVVDDFKQLLPVVTDLRSKALRPRHWADIQAAIGHEIDPEQSYTLGDLLDMHVVEHQPEISTIAVRAISELSLEEMMEKKVISVWNALEFNVNPYKDSKEVFILGSLEDITAALDESLVTINTVLGSRFCAHIRSDVENYQKRLMLLSETLDEWLNCQKQWMYLEAILFADDIKRDLPEESKRFAAVDRSWKSIMKRTYNHPKALEAGTIKGLKETLVRHNEVLEGIQKSLENYLEKKRSTFPRFYFLSNDELLEILAQSRDPQAVQPHLRKCFDALNRLEFGKEAGSVDIHAMLSPEGERVQLPKNLNARGNVEHWLRSVQDAMVLSLRGLMKEGVADYARKDRSLWVRSHAGQIVATVAQMMWTLQTEQALRHPTDPAGELATWYERNVAQLAQLTDLVRSELSKLERRVIVALVTTDVHARDIVEELKDSGTTNVGSFRWQQQLRYYWDDSKADVLVRQSNSLIYYGYEYQGPTTRLVITPLTDRCWMTITGAFHLKLGAAPAGPAGTGKTESSKDLAKALAIQCIVFNCSEQIDYVMLGKLFSGLAQSGAWTCLDEFNRIDIEVLSVVAQQLQQLRQGLVQNLAVIPFEGRTISLKPHCVIITMNPGYAGRTELPDNLKVQFRPVAMMVPDYALIAEISLFAEGFDDAKNLSRKMTRLYRLSSEQLSQQKHYDFGMRAVKSVLVMAGALKRANPALPEEVVLIRAMRDSNVPKFLADDLPLFHAIVGDLFPGVEVPTSELGDLQSTVNEQLAKAGKQRVEPFVGKIMQLYETFNVRFGVVLVGPTGAGKTTCYKTLASAMTTLKQGGSKNEQHQLVHMQLLNPKCISMGELYGEFNDVTQEWKDGLASSIIRAYSEDETQDRKWTVFDGPIDALWIENMNTVLDDNMMLCLANGQRIKLKPSQRMLFEVQDLEAASPATVSRLGVVYMTPTDLGWLPIVQSWLPKEMPDGMPQALKDHILGLFMAAVEDGLVFRRLNCSEPIATSDVQAVTSLCRLLTAMIRTAGEKAPDTGVGKGLDMSRPIDELKRAIDSMFAFSYAWAIGGSIASDGFDKFDAFMRGHKTSVLGNIRYGSGTVFDAFPDITQAEMPWRRWSDVVPAFTYDREQPYFSMVVPTVDTVRYDWLLSTSLSQLYPVFFTGLTGTGKTVIVQDLLNRASTADYRGACPPVAPIVINFSARTSSMDTQITIENKMEKKKRTQLGAPVGKRMVVFVDDINMPAVETYGAQPPIELLRLLVDAGGMYDRHKLFWKEVVDTVLVCAAAPPGGGRAAITPRITRHFHMLCVPVASDDVFKHIFGSIFTGFVSTFPEDVRLMAPKAVSATIEVFNRIRENMRPTPAKSHYTFNLRDVSKVFQGMLMIAPKECPTGDHLTRLWVHECMRVFHDRLIDADDKHWFTTLSVELCARYFGKTGAGWSHEDLFEKKPILYVDFLRPSLDDGPGIYEEAPSMEKVVSVLDENLEDYNLGNPTQMRLVFFRDAVEHVARVSRILRQPRGNAMLIGVGGSGKQSLTRMACHLAQVDIFTIELVRGYDGTAFREDIKKLMQRTGVEGRPVAFLFGDTQIVQEGFLEDISNILNTGEVPGLFGSDEVSKIIEDVRPVAEARGIPGTRDNVYRLFVNRVRDNLHIILTMSPVGTALRVRCRQFPSLINCCTIDWYSAWPEDALLSVARRFIGDEESIPPETKPAIAEMCKTVHLSVAAFGDRFHAELQRRVYTTPKSYLDLINLYLSMLAEKRTQLSELRNTLFVGARKLEESNSVVASLKEELTKLQPVIDEKSKEAAAMLIQVSKDQEEADKIKSVVEADAREVQAQAAEVAIIQADAQKDLDIALPALQKAEDALSKLDKKDIDELRNYKAPTPTLRVLTEAICCLLGEDKSWDSAKRVLGRSTFMSELIEYDRDNIPPKRLAELAKYVVAPELDMDVVSRASKAAVSLALWVHAVHIYSTVAKEVEPKRKRLEEMNAKLSAANAILKEKQDALQAILDKVAALQAQCTAVTNEKERLAAEAQLTKDRLERAGKLTSGLSDEGVRWKASVERYDAQITALLGDVLLSAACISYYGAFTGTYRAEMITSWLDGCRKAAIPVTADFSLMTTLGDPVQVRDWQICGLPTDSVSTDSAILVTRGRRWPLLIDPQEQAKKWIRSMEKARLQITRFSNPRWQQTLESCIRLGNALLIEDCGETLDPALEPVLQRATFKQGGRLLIHLGDSDVDYNPDFKLYLTTKLANPHYLPEVCIKVTVINFTVTLPGLVDQLLGAVVRKERPDVEKRKNDLVVSMAKDKKQLKELEDKILRSLRESSGNILDDSVLINTLAESKELSKAVEERLRESEATEKEINTMRDKYRPVAVRGALLYFVIADLALIDPMYQFSLNYFAQLFNRCIDTAEKSDVLDKRLEHLMAHLTFSSYTNVCRGLFEAHKLLYSFLICTQLMRNDGSITGAEWSFLLRGAGMVVNPLPNPAPAALPEIAWNLAYALDQAVPSMKGLCSHIADASQLPRWLAWAQSEEPHLLPLPAPFDTTLNMMQKMLVLKVFREEKLLFATKTFVAANLGPAYVESPPVSIADVFKESREDTPIIFILSVGADPTSMLWTYAKAMNYTNRLRLISLGQGQGPRAQQLIEYACSSGDWVLLQNCHLARSWMPQLEKIVESFAERKAGTSTEGAIHPDFRLFLTSMPAAYFPVPVLQNGMKLTNEPPKGIRANLSRSLAQLESWSPFESCDGAFDDGMLKLRVWKKLAFALCFFHAVVQERRKFGPLGFNIRYEINDSDLETSVAVLKLMLVDQPMIPWEALQYVTGQINYGGRVTDDWDRRCLMAILGRYYTPAVLDDGYKLSPSGIYYAPPVGSLDSYKEYVAELPLNDAPEIFGMHNNANIANQQAETDAMLTTALSLQPRSASSGSGKSPDEIVAELSAEIEEALPAKLRVEDAGATTFEMKGEHMDSLGTVLSQEIARFNKLLGVMATSLSDLQRAIRGEVLLSEELDKMYTALLNNKVPANWEAAAYPSLKPLASWVKDLHARIAFMHSWLTDGAPIAFWLSGFFFPQGFLTGALQNHARKYHLAIDTLGFATQTLRAWSPEELGDADAVADGVLVYGLYMDGARWNADKQMIDDSNPGEIYSPWPVVHFIPVKGYVTPPGQYSAPVYKATTRAGVLSTTGISSSFVTTVDAPTDRAPEYWIFCGAALVLQLNV